MALLTHFDMILTITAKTMLLYFFLIESTTALGSLASFGTFRTLQNVLGERGIVFPRHP